MTRPLAKLAASTFALLIGTAAPAVSSTSEDFGFLKFTAGTTMLRGSEAVEVHVGLTAQEDGNSVRKEPTDADVWFFATFRKTGTFAPQRFRWTDGARCPKAVTVLRQVRDIEMPHPVLPLPDAGRDGEAIIADGRWYTLDVNSSDVQGQSGGEIHFASNIGTELSVWAEKMLTTLAPCWSTTVPQDIDANRGTNNYAEAVRAEAQRKKP